MRKGFTLVEVLAVIVILGLLIAIITPTVNNLIKDSEDALESKQINTIIKATKQYVTMNSDLLPDEGDNTCIDLLDLIDNGVIDNDIVINPKTKKEVLGCVLISYNENYNQYEYQFIDDSHSSGVKIYNFAYTGDEQTFRVYKSGYYKLEIWGAQGGGENAGYGGYSTGTVYLNRSEILYLNIGGQGGSYSGSNGGTAGYNGGGAGGNGYSTYSGGSGGGGATHIAKVSGVLSKLSSKVQSILIVAGGGGGTTSWSTSDHPGGSGGGIVGGNATGMEILYSGGDQSSGYEFGLGQPGRDSVGFGFIQAEGNGGCGGGLYGGASTTSTDPYSDYSGSGGSGYIGNDLLTDKVMYCYNCTESDIQSTYTVSTTGISSLVDSVNCPSGYSSSPVSRCAKAGDGYAIITYLGE